MTLSCALGGLYFSQRIWKFEFKTSKKIHVYISIHAYENTKEEEIYKIIIQFYRLFLTTTQTKHNNKEMSRIRNGFVSLFYIFLYKANSNELKIQIQI